MCIRDRVAEGQFNLGVVRYRLLYENYFMSALAERELKSEPISVSYTHLI